MRGQFCVPIDTRSQLSIQHVAGFRDRGDQQVVDPSIVVAIPVRPRLVAMHLDGGAVDIQRDRSQLSALPLGLDPAARHLQHRFAQDLVIGRGGRQACEPRLGRLRGRPSPLQRCQSGYRTGGQAESRIMAQSIGIVVVAQPCATKSTEVRVKEARSRVTSTLLRRSLRRDVIQDTMPLRSSTSRRRIAPGSPVKRSTRLSTRKDRLKPGMTGCSVSSCVHGCLRFMSSSLNLKRFQAHVIVSPRIQ